MRMLQGVELTREEVLKAIEGLEDAETREEIDAVNKMYGLNIPYDAQYRGLWDESQFIWGVEVPDIPKTSSKKEELIKLFLEYGYDMTEEGVECFLEELGIRE